jgi:hypothetical protein
MVPENKASLEKERTEALPAQERVATGGEAGSALSAEQVYAQRLAENLTSGDCASPSFIP